MAKNLKQKTTQGLLWSSIDRFSSQGIQFIFSIFLARLLSPNDYGIVAMTIIFFAIAQTFVDSGFSGALVRKNERTEEDFSTCFYFNIIIGILCYCILYFTSPIIAKFYNQPILDPIIKVSGLTIIINSLCIVQQAQFTIKVDFKSQAKISIISTIASGISGIIIAYWGYGVWALIWQGLIYAIFRMALMWIMSGWYPITGFSKEAFHNLFGYGSKMLASGLIGTIYVNVYPIIIGKFYSPSQLGHFSRAQGWVGLPSSNITGILQRVSFPVLSIIQNDDELLANSYRKLLKLSAFIVFPLMMLLAASASPLIRVVITSKWDSCVPYMQILCFDMMWYPIHAINLNLLQVKGRSDLFLRLEVIKKIIGILVMIITVPLGVKAMCFGLVFTSFIALFINTYYTGKLIKIGYLKQMKDLTPILLISFITGFLSFAITFLFSTELSKLFFSIITGIFIYLFMSRFWTKEELKEVINIIKRK
ncbi:lipopolysaccharide biosynthesis protein [Prevotella sp. HUN102]|uniref:lipopolysaccharide biosynthesis protein n=1 Tax=Prevotella sp. HUN102 TaxID=1392486 RepID=UPI0004921AAE|nr:lipopolysaccharide biosynthesis protein [Prevotella sp. HUN102]